jgi:hypothetical protein
MRFENRAYVVRHGEETLGITEDLAVAQEHLRAAWAKDNGVPVEEIPAWLGWDLKLGDWFLCDLRTPYRLRRYGAYEHEKLL